MFDAWETLSRIPVDLEATFIPLFFSGKEIAESHARRVGSAAVGRGSGREAALPASGFQFPRNNMGPPPSWPEAEAGVRGGVFESMLIQLFFWQEEEPCLGRDGDGDVEGGERGERGTAMPRLL